MAFSRPCITCRHVASARANSEFPALLTVSSSIADIRDMTCAKAALFRYINPCRWVAFSLWFWRSRYSWLCCSAKSNTESVRARTQYLLTRAMPHPHEAFKCELSAHTVVDACHYCINACPSRRTASRRQIAGLPLSASFKSVICNLSDNAQFLFIKTP
jgi:hypothetical protein